MRNTVVTLVAATLSSCGGTSEGSDDIEFSDLRAEEITSSRAVIRFTTSRPTSCEVEFGLAEDNLPMRATDPSMLEEDLSATHTVPLEDLIADTTYFYRGYVVDNSGNEYRSQMRSFATLVDDAPALINYALGATISEVSSNFGGGANDSTWGADNAIDGQMATEWATHGDGDGAYIAIDLGQARTLTRLRARSRKMTDGSSIVQSVEITIDGADPIGPFSMPNPDEVYSFELEPAVVGRVVHVAAVASTGGNTGLKEIELLGE